MTAAAALTVLPPEWKADLLAEIATVLGTDELRAAIAAVPSGRADLDVFGARAPARRGVQLPTATVLEHRLQVRIYPEPLAVDTHEPELTEIEAAAAQGTGPRRWPPARTRPRLGAWRALCVGRSTRRAAWIAHTTEPPDAQHTPGALAAAARVRSWTCWSSGCASWPIPRASSGAGWSPRSRRPSTTCTRASRRARASGQGQGVAVRAARLGHGAPGGANADGLLSARQWLRDLTGLRDALAGLADEGPPRPRLSDTERRPSTWTRAARSGVLPDRFAVVPSAAAGSATSRRERRSPSTSRSASTHPLRQAGSPSTRTAICWSTRRSAGWSTSTSR